MLELAILGVLKDGNLHGYELKKRLVDSFGVFSSVSFGSLYPALARLEKAGAVTTIEGPPVPAVPERITTMTGSLGGELAAFRNRRSAAKAPKGRKAKRVYSLTSVGVELFNELAVAESSSGDDERNFNLRLTLARHLEPAARLRLLTKRKDALAIQQHDAQRALGAAPSPDPAASLKPAASLDPYTQALIEHTITRTRNDIEWLDRLIAEESGRAADNIDSRSTAS